MRRLLPSVLSLVVVAALVGCTPGSPTPTPMADTAKPVVTSTPTPTPTESAPVAASIVVSAAALTVLDAEGSAILSLPFTGNGDDAATQLGEVLAASPTATANAGGSCARAGTDYDFGGLVVVGAGTITMAPPAAFTVRVTGSSTAAGVAITGPGGVQIGASLADVVAAIPSADDFDTNVLVLENAGGTGPDVTGVLGYAGEGSLSIIASPVYVFGDC